MNSTAKAPAITVAYVIKGFYQRAEEFGSLLFEYAKGHMKLPPNDAAVRLIQHTVGAAQ